MVLAQRELNQQEFEEFYSQYQYMSTLLSMREENLEQLYDRKENNLTIVGCTAVEDKLQEQVPETIEFLLEVSRPCIPHQFDLDRQDCEFLLSPVTREKLPSR